MGLTSRSQDNFLKQSKLGKFFNMNDQAQRSPLEEVPNNMKEKEDQSISVEELIEKELEDSLFHLGQWEDLAKFVEKKHPPKSK